MAGALGLLLGGVLGYEGMKVGQQRREEEMAHQHRDELAQGVISQILKSGNTAALKDKSTQQFLDASYGKGNSEKLIPVVEGMKQMQQQQDQQLQQALNQSGANQAPGSPEEAFAKAQAVAQMMGHPEFGAQHQEELKALHSGLMTQYTEGMRQKAAQAKQEITPYQAQSLGLREKEIEQTGGLREAAMAQAAATQSQANATREEAIANEKYFRQQSLDASKTKNEDEKKAKVETLGKSLDSMRDKVLEDFQKAPSKDAKSRVDSYNASARLFFRRHADTGAPTLLKYSEVPGVTGGLLGNNPSVTAAPPQYGTNKRTGQSGWRDADGNFYPDAGTN